MIELVPALPEHVAAIAADPRPADAAEVRKLTGKDVGWELGEGLRLSSRAYTALQDGVPVAMMGVVPWSALSGIGAVWMLGSARMDNREARRALLALAPGVLGLFRQLYPGMLFNIVDARNGAAVRFLRWAGFTVKPAIPIGAAGELFHPFYLLGAG